MVQNTSPPSLPAPQLLRRDPTEQPTRRLWRELRPYRKLLLGGMALLFVAGPAALIPNLIWMVVVDVVLLDEQIHLLLPALAVAVGTYGFSLLCGAWRDRLFEKAGQTFIHDLRGRLYHHLLQQPPSYLHQQKSGDLQSRVISDVDAVQSSLLSGFTSMVQECYTFLLVLAAIVWISPLIGAAVFIPLTIAYFMLRHFNPRLKNYYREARTALGEVGARLQETLGGFPVIKIFSREDSEQHTFRALTGEHLQKTLKAVYLRTRIFPLVFSMAFTTNVLMLGLGAWLVYLGHFTIGGLVALRGFWWQLNSPVRTLAQVNDLLQRALAASSRIYALLDTPIQLPDTPEAAPVKGA
ncbi:MAG: hypothetical protein JJT75_10645 [Opitutales bacterium]|nr:hypothetical protein [Opitutales bacterium]MCH8541365.1 hypothetical protein [Opitutales bacterium]